MVSLVAQKETTVEEVISQIKGSVNKGSIWIVMGKEDSPVIDPGTISTITKKDKAKIKFDPSDLRKF